MLKKFAPLALLFGLLSALLLGGASTAQATSTTGSFTCQKGVVNVNVVTCNNVLNNITVNITGNDVLSDNQINVLTDNLNNLNVLNVTAIKNVVINTYKSFNINILNIQVCIASVCV